MRHLRFKDICTTMVLTEAIPVIDGVAKIDVGHDKWCSSHSNDRDKCDCNFEVLHNGVIKWSADDTKTINASFRRKMSASERIKLLAEVYTARMFPPGMIDDYVKPGAYMIKCNHYYKGDVIQRRTRVSYRQIMQLLTQTGRIPYEPGVVNITNVHHDDWCPIYQHKECECNFYITLNGETIWTVAETIQFNKNVTG